MYVIPPAGRIVGKRPPGGRRMLAKHNAESVFQTGVMHVRGVVLLRVDDEAVHSTHYVSVHGRADLAPAGGRVTGSKNPKQLVFYFVLSYVACQAFVLC